MTFVYWHVYIGELFRRSHRVSLLLRNRSESCLLFPPSALRRLTVYTGFGGSESLALSHYSTSPTLEIHILQYQPYKCESVRRTSAIAKHTNTNSKRAWSHMRNMWSGATLTQPRPRQTAPGLRAAPTTRTMAPIVDSQGTPGNNGREAKEGIHLWSQFRHRNRLGQFPYRFQEADKSSTADKSSQRQHQ